MKAEACITESLTPMRKSSSWREGDLCLREQVRVEAKGQAFEVSAIEAETSVIPPHLDPPFGVRQSWLDDQLGKHTFVVLLFYRGLW